VRDEAIGAPTSDLVRTHYETIIAGDSRSGPRGRVLFCVSSDDLSTGKGDLYVGLGLARALNGEGWGVSLWTIDRMAEPTPDDIDVAVVMIESWVPGYLAPRTKAVAWVRNWTDEWASLPYLEEFAEIWCSSSDSAAAIAAVYAGDVRVVPLASDVELFTQRPVDREQAVVTTANFWGVARAVQPALEAVASEVPVVWYGANSAFLQLGQGIDHRDAIDYFALPEVYSSFAIVVDDLIGAAAQYGNQNSRLFDALLCGAVVITNEGRGLDELGLSEVPTYREPHELLEIVRGLLADPEGTEALGARLRDVAIAQHTWSARAAQLGDALDAIVARPEVGERAPLLQWTADLRQKMREDRRAHDDYASMYYGAAREAERLNAELQHLLATREQRRYRAADAVMRPVSAVRRRLNPPTH
jgi:hypothetical protein